MGQTVDVVHGIARLRVYAEPFLWLTFGCFAVALLARAFAGDIVRSPITIRSPFNVESFTAVSFVLLVLLRAKVGAINQEVRPGRFETAGALVLIASLCFVSFYHSLAAPFLFDDYGHVTLAAHAGMSNFLRAFYVPHQDIFYRPLGFLSFAVDVHWAHFDSFRWHAWSLLIHILNSGLVYLFIRQLGFSVLPAALGAAVFAIHGSRAEAVCWTDARFDLLSAFFVLLTLLCVGRYRRTAGYGWLSLALLLAAAALFSKEAAYALPFIVFVLAALCAGHERRRLVKMAWALAGLCVLHFAYRLWIIGGVGGYQSEGHANVLSFSAFRSIKALLWRLWAIIFFPINWTPGPDRGVQITLLVFITMLAGVAVITRMNKRHLLGSLALLIAASLPVQHLLLLESDLAGARLLYLPVLGLAVFWAAVFEAHAARRYSRFAIAIAVLGFNLCCLEWNIGIWMRVAKMAQVACRTFGQTVTASAGKVEAVGLPVKYDGVFFLSDAFPECVEMNAGVPASRVIVSAGEVHGEVHRKLRWDPRQLRFEPALQNH